MRQLSPEILEVEVPSWGHYRTQTDQNRELFLFIGIFGIVLATIAFLLYVAIR
jgi:hypothetical protein